MNPSQMPASCDPPPSSIDALDSLCEHCYGLTMDCLHCKSAGDAHSEHNMWDPWQYSDLESSPHDLAESFVPGHQQDSSIEPNYDDFFKGFGQSSYTNAPQQFATQGSGDLSCDESSKPMVLSQSQDVPAYRRHKKSQAQVELLKGWFETNPTPTGPQLSEYAKVAGLEKDQVRNWFVNQRRPGRRLKPKNVPEKARVVLKRYSGELNWGSKKSKKCRSCLHSCN